MTRVALSPTNHFIRSDAIQNAAWTKGNITPTDATGDVTAPDGTSTATKILETAINAAHFFQPAASPVTVRAGQDWQCSFWIKGGALGTVRRVVWVWNDALGQAYVVFNPRTGLVDAQGANIAVGGTMFLDTNQFDPTWYRCTCVLRGAIPAGQEANTPQGFWELDNGVNGGGLSNVYLGDVAAGVYVAGLTLAPGIHPAIYTRTDGAAVIGNARGLAAYP